MRIIGALLIAFAIMGIAAATVEQVQITSPTDTEFNLGDTIKIRSHVSSTNDGSTFVRMFIDGNRVLTSNWKPDLAGVYTITVEAADNKEFTNSESDSMTITVNPPPESE
jgi:hypothetical protein